MSCPRPLQRPLFCGPHHIVPQHYLCASFKHTVSLSQKNGKSVPSPPSMKRKLFRTPSLFTLILSLLKLTQWWIQVVTKGVGHNQVSIRLSPYCITQHNLLSPSCCRKNRFVSIIFTSRDARAPGGGVLHQIFSARVQHVIQIWPQSDLRFCENNGSKDLKSMKKGSFGSKIKGKFIQNA